jgi:ABC-type bacteriocin/lantibiotic exporter with double-glycine peptidase domain
MALPRGLETHVTAGGSPLSDSQVIRLMLARALAGSPRLLLIDSLLDRLPDDQLATVRDALLSIESHTTIVMVTGREFLVNSFETHLTLGPHLTSPEGTNSQPSPQTHPAPLQLLSFAR